MLEAEAGCQGTFAGPACFCGEGDGCSLRVSKCRYAITHHPRRRCDVDYRRVASRVPSLTGVSATKPGPKVATPFGSSTITVLP